MYIVYTWKYKCIAHYIAEIVVKKEKKGIQTQQTTPKNNQTQDTRTCEFTNIHVHVCYALRVYL